MIVDQNGAGAAFAQPATVFRSVEAKIISKDIEQRRFGLRRDPRSFAIDGQINLDGAVQHIDPVTLAGADTLPWPSLIPATFAAKYKPAPFARRE